MISLPISMGVAHFVGDFLLQSNMMALGKSKWTTLDGASALVSHALVYSLCFLPWGLSFALVTFFTHLVTDALTSRYLTSKLWFVKQTLAGRVFHGNTIRQTFFVDYEVSKRHWFFVAIGFDQLIHMATLAGTLWILA